MTKSLDLKGFLMDEGGQELAEFALVLSVFSIIAMVGFALIAAVANSALNTQQSSLSSSSIHADTL